MSLATFLIGVAIGAGAIGEQPTVVRYVTAALTIFLSVFGFYHGARHRKTIHIDITGTGQLRLSEVSVERPCTDTNWPHLGKNGEVVHLLRDTTVWPYLLLLCVQNESGEKMSLAILPDSVSKDSFRALMAACRWILGQGNRAQAEKF